MILWEHPISPYARKVKLALLEKGIAFERRQIGIHDFDGDTFTKLNPRREVPVLIDGDQAISDSTIICEYLEEKYPEPPLYPKTPLERARMRMLEELADTQVEASVWGLFEIRMFSRATGALADEMTKNGTALCERHLDRLERELAGRPFLSGETFGVADCAWVPHSAGMALFGIKPGPSRPLTTDWVKRVRTRPSVMEDQAQVKASMATADASDIRKRARQYRDHRLEWMVKTGGVSIVTDGLKDGSIQLSRDA